MPPNMSILKVDVRSDSDSCCPQNSHKKSGAAARNPALIESRPDPAGLTRPIKLHLGFAVGRLRQQCASLNLPDAHAGDSESAWQSPAGHGPVPLAGGFLFQVAAPMIIIIESRRTTPCGPSLALPVAAAEYPSAACACSGQELPGACMMMQQALAGHSTERGHPAPVSRERGRRASDRDPADFRKSARGARAAPGESGTSVPGNLKSGTGVPRRAGGGVG